MQMADYERTIALLKAKLETMQAQERDSGKTIRELQAERGTDNCLKDKIIDRLETEAVQKDREIEIYMHKNH